MYRVVDVTLVDKHNNIYAITINDGSNEITIRMNKKELETAAGKKSLKKRVVDEFKKLQTRKDDESSIKTAIEAALL